jgi:BirA family biotin operon repressor/biotin-[acetyl-CoA-carboxylase] ligase
MLFNEATLRQQSKIDHQTAIHLFPTIDSTNRFLLEQAPNLQPAFCLSETQTAGRGQQGRTWVSPKAQNIYLSYLTYSEIPLHQLQDASIKVGKVLLNHLTQELKIRNLHLKWPNDILFEQKQKLAGILVETKSLENVSALVIGIGLNVNMKESTETISQAWTSLTNITHKTYDLNDIAAGLMAALDNAFAPKKTMN